MKLIKTDMVFMVGVFLINIIVRLPFLNLPANYDETNYLNGVSAIVEHKLNPFTYFWGYKPPVLFEPVAVAWSIFGESLGWARIYVNFLSSLALVYVYLLAKLLFGRKAAVFSVLILFFLPLFMVQSLVYQDAVALTAFFLMTLYYFFRKDYVKYLISAILMVLTKEVAVFIPVFLFLFNIINQGFSFKKVTRSLKYVFPLVFFGIWICLNKLYLGWFVWPFNVEIMNFSKFFETGFEYYIYDVFLSDKLGLYFSVILAGWLVLNRLADRRAKKINQITVLFVLTFIFYFYFCFLVGSLTRYILFGYVLILILLVYNITVLFKKRMVSGILILILLILIISNVFSVMFKYDFKNGDRDLRLFSNVWLNRETIDYVTKNYTNPVLVTVWPMTNFLDLPKFGYVKTGFEDIETVECHQTVDIKSYKEKYPNRKIVVVSPLNLCDGRDIGAYTDLKIVKTLEFKIINKVHEPVYIYEE